MVLLITTLRMKSFIRVFQVINKEKVAKEILHDGKYDAILDVVKKELSTKTPALQEIRELMDKDVFYIAEYKDLNRWGELSSVHLRVLEMKESDTQKCTAMKETLNKNREFLINAEEYQIPSKSAIYLAWTGFIALPAIYVIDNIVRLATDLYIDGQESSVYISFFIVVLLSIWGFSKVKNNHSSQHNKYIKLRQECREFVRVGLEKRCFSFEEVYLD